MKLEINSFNVSKFIPTFDFFLLTFLISKISFDIFKWNFLGILSEKSHEISYNTDDKSSLREMKCDENILMQINFFRIIMHPIGRGERGRLDAPMCHQKKVRVSNKRIKNLFGNGLEQNKISSYIT